MRSAEQEADVDVYLEALDLVLTSVPKGKSRIEAHAVLANLLVLFNPGIGSVDVEDMGQIDRGSRIIAGEVLETNPNSPYANEIYRFGINTPLPVNERLLSERFSASSPT